MEQEKNYGRLVAWGSLVLLAIWVYLGQSQSISTKDRKMQSHTVAHTSSSESNALPLDPYARCLVINARTGSYSGVNGVGLLRGRCNAEAQDFIYKNCWPRMRTGMRLFCMKNDCVEYCNDEAFKFAATEIRRYAQEMKAIQTDNRVIDILQSPASESQLQYDSCLMQSINNGDSEDVRMMHICADDLFRWCKFANALEVCGVLGVSEEANVLINLAP